GASSSCSGPWKIRRPFARLRGYLDVKTILSPVCRQGSWLGLEGRKGGLGFGSEGGSPGKPRYLGGIPEDCLEAGGVGLLAHARQAPDGGHPGYDVLGAEQLLERADGRRPDQPEVVNDVAVEIVPRVGPRGGERL